MGQTNGQDLSIIATSDFSSKYSYLMAIDSSGQAALPTAKGQRVDGVMMTNPSAAQVGSYRYSGSAMVFLGGSVTAGQELTPAADGRAIAKSSDDDFVFGVALQSGSAGDRIEVLVLARAERGPNFVLPIHVLLANIPSGDVVTSLPLGIRGTIKKVQALVTNPATTAAKAATLTPYIGTTAVTGGVVSLTSSNCTPLGAVIAGTAITAANVFQETDTISIKGSSVTAFVEGSIVLLLTIGPAS